MMYDEGGYYSPSEMFTCMNTNTNTNSKKKKMMNNKRRFSDEQVKSLESIFENETKLEPKKKLQVARELGLQPRQVAIWFQNKRARYKSKQIERDFSVLRANYNSLTSQFENLKKEKQSLVLQLQKLRDLLEKGDGPENQCRNEAANSSDCSIQSESDKPSSSSSSESENTNNNGTTELHEAKPALSVEAGSEHGASMLSDEDSSENTNYFGAETEMDILTMVEPVGAAVAEASWDDLHDPDSLFDQAVGSCQWWDFWS